MTGGQKVLRAREGSGGAQTGVEGREGRRLRRGSAGHLLLELGIRSLNDQTFGDVRGDIPVGGQRLGIRTREAGPAAQLGWSAASMWGHSDKLRPQRNSQPDG